MYCVFVVIKLIYGNILFQILNSNGLLIWTEKNMIYRHIVTLMMGWLFYLSIEIVLIYSGATVLGSATITLDNFSCAKFSLLWKNYFGSMMVHSNGK